MNEWMTRRSLACSVGLLYFCLYFTFSWWCIDLIERVDVINMQVCELSERMDRLEKAIEDVKYGMDNIYISDNVVHTHMSNVIEDSEEQIRDEIVEGEIETLAQLIEAEAGCEDYLGKCLVADVVLNRIQDDSFPNSVTGVIFEHHVRKSDGVDCYQFATVKYGTFEEAGWYISEDSFKAAYQEYYSPKRIDEKILYFTAGGYNEYCKPAYKYGRHYFGY